MQFNETNFLNVPYKCIKENSFWWTKPHFIRHRHMPNLIAKQYRGSIVCIFATSWAILAILIGNIASPLGYLHITNIVPILLRNISPFYFQVKPNFLKGCPFIANIFNIKSIFDHYWYFIESISNVCSTCTIFWPNITNTGWLRVHDLILWKNPDKHLSRVIYSFLNKVLHNYDSKWWFKPKN